MKTMYDILANYDQIIGIDPGLTGAVAVLRWRDLICLGVNNIPTEARGVGGSKQIDVLALADLLNWTGRSLVLIERVRAMPPRAGDKKRQPGAQSMFNFGESFGVTWATALLSGHALQFVEPATWKRRSRLIGKPKAASLTQARDMFPEARGMLLHGRGHGPKDAAIGRAEAILIARFGWAEDKSIDSMNRPQCETISDLF